jgi:thioredoxin-related protein
MLPTRYIMSALLAACTFAGSAVAGGDLWVTDFEAAKRTAAAEGKAMLVDFTGSDWCGWCKKLDREVFDTDHFKAEAPKGFVLVKLDFPRNKSKMTPELIEQNKKLKTEYGVRGFPTVFLMDAEGKVFGRTGYRRNGPEPYIKELFGMLESKAGFDAAVAKADKAQGLEKAKLLDQAIDSLTGRMRIDSEALVDQIIELDAENEAGLKKKYEFQRALVKVMDGSRRDRAEQRNELDGLEKMYQPAGRQKQQLLMVRARLSGRDMNAVMALLRQIVAIDAESPEGKSAAETLARIAAQMAAVKEKMNERAKEKKEKE